MTSLIELLNSWSQVWLGLTCTILWQSTILGGCAGLIVLFLRRWAPAMCYWVWQIVAIKMLLMPFWIVGVPLPAAIRAPDLPLVRRTTNSLPSAGTIQGMSTTVAWLQVGQRPMSAELQPRAPSDWLAQITWQTWLLITWLVVVVWQISRIGYQRYLLEQWLRLATPASDERLNEMLRDLARRLGLRRVPQALFTNCDRSPFVCGVWRPVIVLQGSLFNTLTANQLRQVLLHELAHVKRNDLVWGWLPAITCIVYWFHPVAHWVAYGNQLDRELACDQLAIAFSGEGAARYANTLIEVAGHASGGSLINTTGA